MRAASVAKDDAVVAKQSERDAENRVQESVELANTVAALAPNEM